MNPETFLKMTDKEVQRFCKVYGLGIRNNKLSLDYYCVTGFETKYRANNTTDIECFLGIGKNLNEALANLFRQNPKFKPQKRL